MEHLPKLLAATVEWISPLLAVTAHAVIQKTDDAKPLWPGCKYTECDRDAAIEKGLKFIDQVAADPKHFSEWGFDLLYCFYTISTTSKNDRLRQMAGETGRKHARRWLQEHKQVPGDDPDYLNDFIVGAATSEKLLGVHDEQLQRAIEEAASHYSAKDFLLFDPTLGPPPADLPESCEKCEHTGHAGEQKCSQCGHPLTFRDPYEVWQHALITTHTGDFYGIKLGASYPAVLHWISSMRPYPSTSAPGMSEGRFNIVIYAITHVLYTLNDYGKYRLSPTVLREEFDYLKSNLAEAKRRQETELLGEFIDSLKAFNTSEADSEIREGIEYLLSHQNADGSWGVTDDEDDDIYQRYHSTWTAIDGLREYSYQGERSELPDVATLVKKAKI